MATITDSNGNPLGYFAVDLCAGEETLPLSILVTPGEDSRLVSTTHAEVRAMARRAGIGSYVDLAGGFDLSSLAVGVAVAFDLKFVAGTFAGLARVQMTIAIAEQHAAGWSA
jgi:hypothetical protein